jgi:hypothetical protein
MWRRAKILAGLSLASWMGAITAARFLAYTHTWLRLGLPSVGPQRSAGSRADGEAQMALIMPK